MVRAGLGQSLSHRPRRRKECDVVLVSEPRPHHRWGICGPILVDRRLHSIPPQRHLAGEDRSAGPRWRCRRRYPDCSRFYEGCVSALDTPTSRVIARGPHTQQSERCMVKEGMPTYQVDTPQRCYAAIVERGVIGRAAEYIPPKTGKVFVVTTEDVWRHAGMQLAAGLAGVSTWLHRAPSL